MNTAEIAIEQLFAGILAMVACLLPFVSVEAAWCVLGASSSLTVGLLGVAYLLGAAFDRVFDGIVGGVEQWARLRFAKERRHEKKPTWDPFPQRQLERTIRGPEGAREWMSHLRTRLRLTRSLAVAAPLVALGAAYQPFDRVGCGDPWAHLFTLEWTAALPTLVLLSAFGLSTRLRPPKTHAVAYDDAEAKARDLPLLDLDARWRDAVIPLVALYAAPLVVVSFVTRSVPTSLAIFGGAYVLGALSLWSWWRLLDAYLGFVGSFGKLEPGERNTAHSRA